MSASAAELQPPVPALADGRYVLGRRLGGGGFAEVWEAKDTALGVQRALKLLSAETRSRRSVRRRLRAEARAMARIDHPNVLRIYDIGAWEDRDFIVMDLAEGGALSDRLSGGGTLSAGQACAWMIQVLAALGAAHDVGVIHRDVKPSNVLLNGSGTALLADFGVALLEEDGYRSTRAGVSLGTFAYMAPEQRLDARSVGRAADLYAVGASLYALVTGGTPVELFFAEEDSPRWAGVPLPLREVIRRATRFDPRDRFEGAREMAEALLEVADGLEGEVYPSAPPRTGTPIATTPSRQATRAAVSMLATLVPRPRRDAPSFDDLDEDLASPIPAPRSERPTEILERPDRGPYVAAGVGFAGASVLLLAVWWAFDPGAVAPPGPAAVIVDALPPVSPAPSVAPVPAPQAPPEPPASPPPSRAEGNFEGSFQGERGARLTLTGSDAALVGTFTSSATWRSGERRTSERRLRGRYEPATGALVLDDAASGQTRLVLTLARDGDQADGWLEVGVPPERTRVRLTRR